jgi:hypothetical protein
MKRMMRKAPPKNSTKERFLVIPQTLNSHNRDLRRLSNHQNLPSNQVTKGDVCKFSGEKCVYMLLAEGHHVYVRDCQEKNRVYVLKHNYDKEKAKKLKLRVNRGFEVII